MDSMSGSLKESEPTSPVSPSSPDLSKGSRATSPVSLAQALSSLQTDTSWRRDGASPKPPLHNSSASNLRTESLKSEALIVIDITTIGPKWIEGKLEGRSQVVAVHFNSLDVIANQDTVVELGSFFQRILPKKPKLSPNVTEASTLQHDAPPSSLSSNPSRFPPAFTHTSNGSTELTFDFHRLTVLLLRSTIKDDALVGRKVATLTISDAHIHSSLAENGVLVQGSLGGLQVLDLTPEGQKHQRVVSVGHDPLVEQNQNLYMLVSQGLYQSIKDKNEVQAFSFKFLQPGGDVFENDPKLSLEIRMASLCYTHSVHFIAEVSACMSEFQQSIANLAMSLKLTAAEVAVDLMHRGTEGLAQTIFIGGAVGNSTINESSSLQYGSIRALDEDPPSSLPSTVRFSALLESPILVLPRSAKSPQVLVAHLGQIEISNDGDTAEMPTEPLSEQLLGGTHQEHFQIEVRDMSLYSLNVDEKWKHSFSHYYSEPAGSGTVTSASSFLRVTAQELYGCASPHGRPILHDTLLKFSLHRITGRPILSDADPFLFPMTDFSTKMEVCDVFQVQGSVVSPLTVSLSKAQYQQIIDSIDNLNWSKVEASVMNSMEAGPDFGNVPSMKTRSTPRLKQRELVVSLKFQLPRFSMQLLDHANRAIVRLSFEDFQVAYEQGCTYSSTILTSLKSLVLEDLMMNEGSKYRTLVASNNLQASGIGERPQLSSCMSSSCPDLRNQEMYSAGGRSLPARLERMESQWKAANSKNKKQKTSPKKPSDPYPETPPSSPHQVDPNRSGGATENLVSIKVLLVDPDCPEFAVKYNSTQRFVEVNFNALDVVVNLESWVMVLDFFGSENKQKRMYSIQQQQRQNRLTAPSPGYQVIIFLFFIFLFFKFSNS